ncbi:hypothetical protein BKI51_02685 [Alphaproteobacteria bacterium AO1-B]|nr:hypothetical protein BKI51_02685 [Alphaproteobacteria bacterium AO1-B]
MEIDIPVGRVLMLGGVVGFIVCLILFARFFMHSGEVLDKTKFVAKITSELPYYSTKLAEICSPAINDSHRELVQEGEDVKKRDIVGAMTSNPAEPIDECIKQFCKEHEMHPEASPIGYSLAQEYCVQH